jgi:asparagine synthase (glutamine-hydrolysing)
MIELAALATRGPDSEIEPVMAARIEAALSRRAFKYRKTLQGRSFVLHLGSDFQIDHCYYQDPALSLICCADFVSGEAASQQQLLGRAPAATVAALYKSHGDPFARRLRGTFAIILYDHGTNTLKAWTDHFGVRRLLFQEVSGCLWVSTSLDLSRCCIEDGGTVDPPALVEYLQYTCVPAPRTIFRHVRRLEPGHVLLSEPSPAVRPYWDMHYADQNACFQKTEETWSSETFEAIRAAVERYSLVDGNAHRLGCFLSGGTDSSSVSGLVGRITGRPPETFSIGFDDPRYNEIEYARIAARDYGSNHHEYFVAPGDILSLLEKAASIYDEPFGNSSIIPTYYCARLAAEHGVTHLMAGDGGDELFGGNARYASDRVYAPYFLVPGFLRRSLLEPLIQAAAQTRLRPFARASSYVRRANLPLPERYASYSFLANVAATDLFTNEFMTSLPAWDPLEPMRRHFRSADARDNLNRRLYVDLKITLTDNDLRKVTAMTELAGVTPRYPLIDPDLAEFSGLIPPELKVKNRQLRYIFKKAMSGFLPPEIIRKKKHGFGLPYGAWVGEHKPLRDFTFDILGSTRCRQRGYFRHDLLEWLWDLYNRVHRIYYGDCLWVFLMLELWHIHHLRERD